MINLKRYIIFLLVLCSAIGYAQSVLEFATGAGNPTGNGPTVANQVITFQKNTNNPSGNTFAAYSTPTVTATFSLTNQQMTMTPSPGVGAFFGAGGSTTSVNPAPFALFPLINGLGGSANNQYTSANSTAGTGINIAANRGVELALSTYPEFQAGTGTYPLPTVGNPVRYQYADLVITFSSPVNNPIIHFTGMGGSIGNPGTYSLVFSQEYQLITSGLTLTRLSGSTEFTVPTSTDIKNGAALMGPTTGSGGASGSVQVNGTNISSLTFRVYLKAQAPNQGQAITWGFANHNAADGALISVSLNMCNAGTNAPALSATSANVCSPSTVNLNSYHTGVTPTGAVLQWYTDSSHTTQYTTPTTATAGTYYAFYYDSVNGCYSPASTVFTVNNFCDADGDGVENSTDLDDDNDGILDCAENGLNKPVNQIFQLNGNASQISSNEVQLTPASNSQAGQMWSYGKVDFTKNFSMPFEAYLGNNDAGADGMAIVFQNDPAGTNAIGATGDGIGARGIKNGVVLELDTYSNTGSPALDPAADHGQIWKSSDQTAITSTVALPNLEDGAWHAVVVNWDSASQTLSYTVDGTLAGTYTGNIVTNYFGGANKVYFGFTASTGGLNNDQRVRFSSLCSLPLELDTDGDNIPNSLDLDSDGDGCFDAIEGGDNITASMLNGIGRINVAANGTTTPVVVDANGVPTIVGASGQAIGQSIDASKNDCLDTDGDGYPDWQDLDSDNDGILDTVECPSTELVTNGTFNSNTTGWTINAGWQWFSPGYVKNETNGATNHTIRQTIYNLDKVKGKIVPLTIKLGAQDAAISGIQSAGSTATLDIMLNGTVYATVTNGALRNNSNVTIKLENGAVSNFVPFGTLPVANGYNWQTFTLWIPYTGPATAELNFRMNAANDDWALDDISIAAMICDTDNDGIPNYLDLDSDGDGCSDAIEGAGNFTASQLTSASGTLSAQSPNQNFGVTVDANGVPTIVGASGQAVGNSQNEMLNDCIEFVCLPDPYAAQQTWWLPDSNTKVRIDFQSGSAVLNNPAAGFLGQGSFDGFEGNTSVTHPITGELLFVTDGNVVYKGSTGVKATGLAVGGNGSSGEAAAVIPDPNGILGRNFLIIGNSAANTTGSLRMAKYDLQTNTVSGVTTILSGGINEALEVIPHTNGTDYWILVSTSDEKVKTYLYSKTTGFNSTLVSSIDVPNLAGVSATSIATFSFISWDPRTPGKVLISRHNKVGLANFDPSTGILGTWDVKVTVTSGTATENSYTGYSVALSPNGRYIYYNEYVQSNNTGILKYYDMQTGLTTALDVSVFGMNGMKIAPDGKLYKLGYISGDLRLLYLNTDANTPPSSSGSLLAFDTGGRSPSLQLPNNVYWGCITCQSGTAAPALASTNITSNPATVGDLIAALSPSNQPAGTVITIHSGTPATDANKLANSTAIVPGTIYYASFYDGLAACYSPTTLVTVSQSICFNDPVLTGNGPDTKVGITLLKRAGAQNADNWPMVRKSGHIALESNTQGFVINRLSATEMAAIKTAGNAVDGMMVFDTTNKCLSIYDGTDWKCFDKAACP